MSVQILLEVSSCVLLLLLQLLLLLLWGRGRRRKGRAPRRCSLPNEHLQLCHQLLHHTDTFGLNRATHTSEDVHLNQSQPTCQEPLARPLHTHVTSLLHVIIKHRYRYKRRYNARAGSTLSAGVRRFDLAAAFYKCPMSAQGGVCETE